MTLRCMVIVAAFALQASAASASMSCECGTWPGGKPDKMVKVTASNATEAVRLAEDKFHKLGAKGPVHAPQPWHLVRCGGPCHRAR